MNTVRLTMAQALVRYLCNQFTEIDGRREPLFPGVFAIFGHGNVTCLSEALEAVKDILPTWRGQNEQSMALAAIGFAKATRRRQIMVATSSIGPGALNMVTAAGVAHTNRLPVLLLAGDAFVNRRPDPVMQQVEHFGNPTISVNDAFKPVTRYWDKIVHPEQIISSLPQAIAVMLDPADCGPAFISLPQDVQEIAWDYPEEFFEPTVHQAPRPRPDRNSLAAALEVLKSAKKPLIISGGGVRYSGAQDALAAFAVKHGIPLCETIAGKGTVTHDHPAHVGPIGIVGSTSANALAGEADVILAVGTRLMDFTTGSWTAFSPEAKFVAINAARFDAHKHRAVAVVGDALEAINELADAIGDYKADTAWTEKGKLEFAKWNTALDGYQQPTNAPVPTYAQVVGIVNAKAGDRDHLITAAGGLPGEVMKNWRVKVAEHLRLRIRLLLHGLRDRGRLGCGDGRSDPHADRHDRRRHLHDDEFGHLFDGPFGSQDDPDRLRQRRLCRHQPPAERQGRRLIQQPSERLPRQGSIPGRLRQTRRGHGGSDPSRRKPGRPRRRGRMGEVDGSDDGAHHCLRRVHMDAWRRLVGCRRPAGQQPG